MKCRLTGWVLTLGQVVVVMPHGLLLARREEIDSSSTGHRPLEQPPNDDEHKTDSRIDPYLGTVMTIEDGRTEILTYNDEEASVDNKCIVYVPNTEEEAFAFAKHCCTVAKYALSKENGRCVRLLYDLSRMLHGFVNGTKRSTQSSDESRSSSFLWRSIVFSAWCFFFAADTTQQRRRRR